MDKFIALKITPEQVFYECNVCYERYKKNGLPYKKAKKVIHVHGNEEHSNTNRIIERMHHSNANHIKTFNQVEIHVTDETIREGFE
jgi:hypothetical protein